jgi:hypothetical protein
MRRGPHFTSTAMLFVALALTEHGFGVFVTAFGDNEDTATATNDNESARNDLRANAGRGPP